MEDWKNPFTNTNPLDAVLNFGNPTNSNNFVKKVTFKEPIEEQKEPDPVEEPKEPVDLLTQLKSLKKMQPPQVFKKEYKFPLILLFLLVLFLFLK